MAILGTKIENKNEIPLLLAPPMLEAIFEIRWELLGDQQTGRYKDPAYPMMYGRMYERFKKDFPLIEDLPSVQMHPEASPYVVRHRMRKDKTSWPLIQVGPGIATVNDAQGYSWTRFKETILRLVQAISDLYPEGPSRLQWMKAEVRYVNGVPINLESENALAFLAEKLHTRIDLDPDLFALNEVEESPVALGLNLAYPLNRPKGHFALSINLGQMENKSAYILQSLIQSGGDAVPQDRNQFEAWLLQAHKASQNSFYSLFKGQLMQSFGRLSQ